LSEDGKELFREKCFHVATFYRAAARTLLQRESDRAKGALASCIR
jgi:hypothetical protein